MNALKRQNRDSKQIKVIFNKGVYEKNNRDIFSFFVSIC